jgi:mono/diheme cytochrome c family protein
MGARGFLHGIRRRDGAAHCAHKKKGWKMPVKHRRTASRLDLRGALVTASIALIVAAGAHADGSGFFDAAQVASGRFDYSQRCSVCHGAQLQGAGAPALHGPTFAAQWNGKALSEFYKYVHDQMPVGQAGTLDGQQYADIVAYMLSRNGFPSGPMELPTQIEELNQIVFLATKP